MWDTDRVVCARRAQHLFLSSRPAEKETPMSFKALDLVEVEEVPEQQVRTAIFGHGMGRIELISPTVKGSGVARFLEKRGEGLHHICIEVEDIEAALEALKVHAAPLIDSSPKPGAGGARVSFVHPKGVHGVLLELRQGPKSSGLR